MQAVSKTLRVGDKRITIRQRLGKGAFGEVYQVEDRRASAVYALKNILCENKSAIVNAVNEVSTLSEVSHKNIIRMVEADLFQDSLSAYHILILTEFCSGGNLNERLKRVSDEEDNAKWMFQTAGALAYLHSCEIVHRDLKPENVLLSNPINEDVKLADFGLAREYVALTCKDIDDDDDDDDDADSWLSIFTQYYMDTFAGTPHWLAPEVFSAHYTEKSDVFSLGVICFAILERDYVRVKGRKFYGAFVKPARGRKIGLGYAMYLDQDIEAEFSPEAQGSEALQEIVLDALEYEARNRPSAKRIHQRLRSAAPE